MIAWLFGLALAVLCVHAAGRGSEQGTPATANTPPAPVQLTAEQDHQRIMDLLRIKAIRRGADGDPNSPNAANYDESKANIYASPPDPLVLKDGKKVTSAEMLEIGRASCRERVSFLV